MKNFRDFLIMNARENSAQDMVGYSLMDTNNIGPLFNFFGHDIAGVFSTNGKLVIEFDSMVAPIGKGLNFDYNKPIPMTEDEEVTFEVIDLGSQFPIASIAIYDLDSGIESIFDMTAEPVCERVVRMADKFIVENSNTLARRLELDGSNFNFQPNKDYCVAITVRSDFLNENYGIGEANILPEDTKFLTEHLKTDIRTTTLFLNRDNETKVNVQFKDKGLNLLQFDRYELHGVSESPLDSSIDEGFFKYGKNEGDVILNLNGIVVRSGKYDTTLIGYNNQNEKGVVLWNKAMVKSRLSITVVD